MKRLAVTLLGAGTYPHDVAKANALLARLKHRRLWKHSPMLANDASALPWE
jgi:hypothetical protein